MKMELPKKEQITFRTRRKLKNKNILLLLKWLIMKQLQIKYIKKSPEDAQWNVPNVT